MKNGPELWDAVIAHLRKHFPDNRMVIAGGAVRDYYLGFEPKDIDVFINVDDELEFEFALSDMEGVRDLDQDPAGERYSKGNWTDEGRIFGVYEYDFAIYREGKDNILMPIQLIVRKFETWKDIVNGFDFDIVKCAYNGVLHNTPEAERDQVNKTFTLPTQPSHVKWAKSYDRYERFYFRSEAHSKFKYVEGWKTAEKKSTLRFTTSPYSSIYLTQLRQAIDDLEI